MESFIDKVLSSMENYKSSNSYLQMVKKENK